MKRRILSGIILCCCISIASKGQNMLKVSNLLKKTYIDSLRVVISGEQSNAIHRANFLDKDTIYLKIIKIKKNGLTKIDTLPVSDLHLKSLSITGALYPKNTKVGDHIDAEYRITDLQISGTPKQRLFNEYYATYGLTIMNCDLVDSSGNVYKLEDRKISVKIGDSE